MGRGEPPLPLCRPHRNRARNGTSFGVPISVETPTETAALADLAEEVNLCGAPPGHRVTL
jgi:hypothetical protein